MLRSAQSYAASVTLLVVCGTAGMDVTLSPSLSPSLSSPSGHELPRASEVPAHAGERRGSWESPPAGSVRHGDPPAASVGHGDPDQDPDLPDQTQDGLCSRGHRHQVGVSGQLEVVPVITCL